MKTINDFLENVHKQIEESRQKIIQQNQLEFEELVTSCLEKGDTLFVANGTAFLQRGTEDSTSDESLYDLIEPICRGVWDIGFDYQYKTEIK